MRWALEQINNKQTHVGRGHPPTTDTNNMTTTTTAPTVRIEATSRSTFIFRSDIAPAADREAHRSGILHAIRIGTVGEGEDEGQRMMLLGAAGREEHAFAWIEDRWAGGGGGGGAGDDDDDDNGGGEGRAIEAVAAHLAGYGFGSRGKMNFVPYSSREGWVHRYPHAGE